MMWKNGQIVVWKDGEIVRVLFTFELSSDSRFILNLITSGDPTCHKGHPESSDFIGSQLWL